MISLRAGTPPHHRLVTSRAWHVWLLALVALFQGAQYLARPGLPLSIASYSALDWGADGWRVFGVLLIATGAWLARPPRLASDIEWPAHLLAVALYTTLCWANAVAGVLPALLALALGMHGGELVILVWPELWSRLRSSPRREGR